MEGEAFWGEVLVCHHDLVVERPLAAVTAVASPLSGDDHQATFCDRNVMRGPRFSSSSVLFHSKLLPIIKLWPILPS